MTSLTCYSDVTKSSTTAVKTTQTLTTGGAGEALGDRLTQRGCIEGRSDDNEEAIRTRLQGYRDQTEPLIAYYSERRILIEVDGDGSIDDVEKRIEEAL